MPSCPIARITRVLEGVRAALGAHERECGDRILAVALNPDDHHELVIAELWGLPVLAWDHVPEGAFRLLCEGFCVLVPQVDTYEELIERWTYHLDRPAPASGPVAA
jgi:hypothetical protein